MAGRTRTVQVLFWVTPEEMEHIRAKMKAIGIENMNAYLRKMAMDGYVIRLDLPELKDLISLMKKTSVNINQIAKRLNESGRMYETDIKEVCENQEKLWEELRSILDRMSRIA